MSPWSSKTAFTHKENHKWFEYTTGTSNHLPRSIEVTLVEEDTKNHIFKLKGYTWNMLNKCHSKKNCKLLPGDIPFTNNPYNVDETLDEYTVRKHIQLKEILKMIKNGADFIFLQEVDWITYSKLEAEFLSALSNVGWAAVITEKSDYCVPLVTLYNTKSLMYNHQYKPVFSMRDETFSGIDTYFKVRGMAISLVNIHLKSNVNYRDTLFEFQLDKVAKNYPTIMGGDINKVPRQCIKSMIRDFKYASFIERTPNGTLTTLYRGESDNLRVKVDDGFFVNPGKTTGVHVLKTDGDYYEILDGKANILPLPEDRPNRFYRSIPGKPCQRFKHIFKDYDIQLADPSLTDFQKNRIASKMKKICEEYVTHKTIADYENLINYHSRYYLNKLLHKINALNIDLPTVYLPEKAKFLLTMDYQRIDAGSISGNPKGLVFLEFENQTQAEVYVKAAEHFLHKTKTLQGQNKNVVSFTFNDAKTFGFDFVEFYTMVIPALNSNDKLR